MGRKADEVQQMVKAISEGFADLGIEGVDFVDDQGRSTAHIDTATATLTETAPPERTLRVVITTVVRGAGEATLEEARAAVIAQLGFSDEDLATGDLTVEVSEL